nr:MAG TPA: hypothetical protein [Caudoviricetes sp.]
MCFIIINIILFTQTTSKLRFSGNFEKLLKSYLASFVQQNSKKVKKSSKSSCFYF